MTIRYSLLFGVRTSNSEYHEYSVNIRSIFQLFENSSLFSEKCREHLGCWGDNGENRAIKGEYKKYPDNPIETCHEVAAGKGNSVFAVQAIDWCFTAADAEQTYQKYGRADNCKNGIGGDWAQDVYKIVPCEPG